MIVFFIGWLSTSSIESLNTEGASANRGVFNRSIVPSSLKPVSNTMYGRLFRSDATSSPVTCVCQRNTRRKDGKEFNCWSEATSVFVPDNESSVRDPSDAK